MEELTPNDNLKFTQLITFVDDRPGHDLRYSISNAKINERLNFSPQHSLEKGLLKTIEWYESRRN